MVVSRHPQADKLGPALGGAVREVCFRVAAAGGRAWLVGGTVRDCALGLVPGDADLEVFGLEPDRLVEVAGQIMENEWYLFKRSV